VTSVKPAETLMRNEPRKNNSYITKEDEDLREKERKDGSGRRSSNRTGVHETRTGRFESTSGKGTT